MASNSTIKIQDTLNWAAAFIQQRPSTGVGGSALEPGLTIANLLMQTIMAPPFKWSWNRVETTYPLPKTDTDVIVTLANWGWLEKATVSDGSAVIELEVSQVLAVDPKNNRPQKIAPQVDNNDGTIVFRTLPAADKDYVIALTFQKAPALATSLGNSTWAPIPDRYAFLYERGMMAHLQAMYSPQLYALNLEVFFRQLIASAEGLTETEKAIFLEDQLRILRMGQYSSMGAAQGKQARQ